MQVAVLPPDHAEFGGRVLAERAFGECELREVLLEPGAVLPTHVHALGSITFVVRGGYEEKYPSLEKSVECRAPCVVMKSAQQAHSVRIGPEGAHVLSVSIDDSLWKEWAACDQRVAGPVHQQSGECLLIAERLHAEFKQPGPGSELIVTGLLGQLAGACISLAARCGSPRPYPWLDEVREHVSRSFRDRLTVKSLAERAGVHPDYLSRRFRSHYGMSLVRYVRQLRLRWASERLLERELSLAQVTREAGFSDQSHFTRAFKQAFGVTPGQYRRSKRRNGAA